MSQDSLLPFIKRSRAKSQSALTSSVTLEELQNDSGPPEIPVEEIQFDKDRDFLGEGAFGTVYRGVCRGNLVAIKVPKKQDLTDSELAQFRDEVKIMRRIFNPNIVLFLGACTDPNNLMIVTDLMMSNVEHLLRQPTPVPIMEALRIAKETALGMNWLHGICQIIHRDLKPANLLLDKNKNVRVTDFGFSQLKPIDQDLKDRYGPKGTAIYMAPEIMRGKEFGFKADVYSFGLILWELITQKELFPQYEEWEDLLEAICERHERPRDFPSNIPQSLKKLITRCWADNPNDRPEFDEICFRLDEIMVDVSLPQDILFATEAGIFWKKYFLIPNNTLKTKVSWHEFVHCLAEYTKLKDDDFQDIQEVFLSQDAKRATKEEDEEEEVPVEITLDSFAKAVHWYGPFFLSPHASKVLKDMKDLLSQPWFHGNISKSIAEKRLNLRIDGCFLVRTSETERDKPFAISRNAGRAIRHRRISRSPDGKSFSVEQGGKSYPSLQALIKDSSDYKSPCPKQIEDPYESQTN